jgi:hypothetical protein
MRQDRKRRMIAHERVLLGFGWKLRISGERGYIRGYKIRQNVKSRFLRAVRRPQRNDI